MYKVLIVEPLDFSLNALQHLPIWQKACDGYDGFECVQTAHNGQEAVDLASRNQYDLILTEINLPLIDGLQLLKQVRRSNQTPLVVFISDIATFAYAREGFIYGAFDYLPKPVSQADMEALFSRVAKELERLKHQRPSLHAATAFRFDPAQIEQLSDAFCRRNGRVLNRFGSMLHALYAPDQKTPYNPDQMASKLYLSVVEGIYARNPWISLYIPQNFHEQIDYMDPAKPEDYIALYRRKFAYLFEKYCVLNPAFSDDILAKIQLYLLAHPEGDLRLTTIAGIFYLNHTYLSNLYSRRADRHYSDFVTMVKMHRAEYLISYTDLPLADISAMLGYKDFRHFQKLFKDSIGKSTAEYIRSSDAVGTYSI
ncbi:MAG: response regulator [Lachnospiraceae bacterium]|nr:response regulator [Lachnospiraceae bacterium]